MIEDYGGRGHALERACSSESLSFLLRSKQNNNNKELKMGGEEGKRDGDGEKKKREKGEKKDKIWS